MLFSTISMVLRATSDATATTTEPQATVTYVDISTSSFPVSGLGPQLTNLNGTTTVTILSAPAASTVRKATFVSIYNADTVAHEITVDVYDGTNAYGQIVLTLQAGQTLTWTPDRGWSNNLDLLSLFDVDNTWNGANTFLGDLIAGDPGLEAAGITVAATTYNSVLKISDIGGSDVAQLILHRHSTTLPSIIVGSRAHSDTSSHTIVSDGDGLLTIYGVGWDGVDYAIGASISMTVEGTPGAGDMPTKIDLATSPNGTETPVVGLTLHETGVVELPIGQLQFPATQNPSSNANTLDDYEEGTFTPVYTTGGTAPTGVTYSTQFGAYTKVGNKVTLHMRVSLTSKGSGGTGNVQFTGAPFAKGSGETAIEIGYINTSASFPGSTTVCYYAMIVSSTTILLGFYGPTGTGSFAWSSSTNTDDFLVTLTYFT